MNLYVTWEILFILEEQYLMRSKYLFDIHFMKYIYIIFESLLDRVRTELQYHNAYDLHTIWTLPDNCVAWFIVTYHSIFSCMLICFWFIKGSIYLVWVLYDWCGSCMIGVALVWLVWLLYDWCGSCMVSPKFYGLLYYKKWNSSTIV